MSLFGPIYVTSTLTLNQKDAKALQDVAKAVTGIDASLKAVVDKLNEPASNGLTPEQEAQVRDFIAQLTASQTALGAADAANQPAAADGPAPSA